MRVLNPSGNKNDPIDKKPEDLDKYMILAENIQKYLWSYGRKRYPSGKWNSISKVLKLTPKACKRRWRTLKRHFSLGLLTNRQLIDKLQFLKDIPNKIPVSQLPTNSRSYSSASSATSESSNLRTVPLVNSINDENHTFRANEIPVSQLPTNLRSSSNVSSATSDNSNLRTVPLVNSINDENHTVRANEIPVSQLPTTSTSPSNSLLATRENSNLMRVPLVNSINDDENHTFRTNENLVSQLPSNSVSSSDTSSATEECSNLISVPFNHAINNDENHAFKANEVEPGDASKQPLDIETEIREGYDSDLEVIEPYIETIVVD